MPNSLESMVVCDSYPVGELKVPSDADGDGEWGPLQDYGLGTGLGIYQLSCQLEPIPSDWLFGLKRVVVGKVVLGRVEGG